MKINRRLLLVLCLILVSGTFAYFFGKSKYKLDSLKSNFVNPPTEYRPQPFWHINGNLSSDEIRRKLSDAYHKDGFGGVAILPLSPATSWTTGEMTAGTTPEYMTDEYFDRYGDILRYSAVQGTQVILYDDINFPSGTLWHRMETEYPHLTKKSLEKQDRLVLGPASITEIMPMKDEFMGVVAFNTATKERIDLTAEVEDSLLNWKVPEGEWRILSFYLRHRISPKIDYMDSVAVATFIDLSYNEYARHFSPYFRKTIVRTFFDDVGIYPDRATWNQQLSQKFEEKYGRSAVLYYPALWYDIGEETEAARVSFFGLRAEAISEFPRQVAQWCDRYGLLSMGHPPGNYEPTSVDMYGDPFKFYQYTHVPLLDAIHGYPFGRSGFKLISSAADYYDRQEVAAEAYGNYPADMDSLMLYRMGMELMVRGVNFFIPHGMWYDTENVKIPPLISHENELLSASLPYYSDFIARSVSLLNEGNRVAEIAVLYPIQALEGWAGLNPERPGTGKDIPPGTDYHRISDRLTGDIRQDFTFVHPEKLTAGKYHIENGTIVLGNEFTAQQYKLLVIPSQHVMSVETLQWILNWYEQGGRILATGQLPYKSAEFGQDSVLRHLVQTLTSIDPAGTLPKVKTETIHTSGGRFVFLPDSETEVLATTINELLPLPDVRFGELAGISLPRDSNGDPLGVIRDLPLSSEMLGMFSYIHKQRDGRDIYLFANSTDTPVESWVEIRGRHRPEKWNPYTGEMRRWEGTEWIQDETGETYTRLPLKLNAVECVFAISK